MYSTFYSNCGIAGEGVGSGSLDVLRWGGGKSISTLPASGRQCGVTCLQTFSVIILPCFRLCRSLLPKTCCGSSVHKKMCFYNVKKYRKRESRFKKPLCGGKSCTVPHSSLCFRVVVIFQTRGPSTCKFMWRKKMQSGRHMANRPLHGEFRQRKKNVLKASGRFSGGGWGVVRNGQKGVEEVRF